MRKLLEACFCNWSDELAGLSAKYFGLAPKTCFSNNVSQAQLFKHIVPGTAFQSICPRTRFPNNLSQAPLFKQHWFDGGTTSCMWIYLAYVQAVTSKARLQIRTGLESIRDVRMTPSIWVKPNLVNQTSTTFPADTHGCCEQ